MGIQATARRNRLTIPGAYLMVASTTMQKYFRPLAEPDPDTGQYGSVPGVMYIGRVQMYYDYEDRMSPEGQVMAAFAFNFVHVNGADPVHECYAHIHANGVEGWALNDLVDVLVDPQP